MRMSAGEKFLTRAVAIEDVDRRTRSTRRDAKIKYIGRRKQQQPLCATDLAEDIGHDLSNQLHPPGMGIAWTSHVRRNAATL